VLPQLKVLADFSLFVGAAQTSVLYGFLIANQATAPERVAETRTGTGLEKA
jgi:hypothetical protein